MAFPPALRRLAGTPEFWAGYLFEEDEWHPDKYPELAELRVAFDVCPKYQLTLGLTKDLSYHSLGFVRPRRKKPVQIGWDDQAHWHPNTLRWEELDLFGRCLALADPSLPHPGLPVLLLNRFTPVCLNTDADVAFPLIEGAWRSLGLFDGRRLDDLVERFDRRHAEFVWTQEPCGWTLGQPEGADERTGWDCYTLRTADNPDFPFREWAAFVAAAEAFYAAGVNPDWLSANGRAAGGIARGIAETGDPAGGGPLADALQEAGCEHAGVLAACRSGDPAQVGWVVEWLLGMPAGSVLRRIFGPTSRKRVAWYRFTVEWPEPVEGRGTPTFTGNAVAEDLNRSLGQMNLGNAAVTGGSGTMDPDGYPHSIRYLSRSSDIQVDVRDDFDRGVAVIREVLRKHGTPKGLVLRQDTPEPRPIPVTKDE
jgi:hypothetical protein